jgi:hypothetical protein
MYYNKSNGDLGAITEKLLFTASAPTQERERVKMEKLSKDVTLEKRKKHIG